MRSRLNMPAAVLVTLVLSCGAARSGERHVVDIFNGGKLAPGVKLENASVQGNLVVTSPIGKSWGNPHFYVKGLNVDISKVDLSQVHFRLVATGGRANKPGYAEIQIDNTGGVMLRILQFPFRSYNRRDPNYMMKSCEHSRVYATKPEGKHVGKITAFRVNTSSPGGVVMRFSKIQILIDKSMGDRYPDDPKPDPNWRGGKIAGVYAISGSDRVFLKETDSPLEHGNTVWKNGRITVSGARNETVPFQVVIEAAGAGGLNGVDVRFTGVSKPGASIDNSKAREPKNPYNYVGRHVQLYRARYIHYDKVDSMGGGKIVKASKVVGKHIPEVQIPFEAKWGGAPFPVFPGQTQSVWIDTYIPKDAKPGLYRGKVEVLVGGRVAKSLPVELTVHDFALPNRPSTCSLMWGTVPNKHKLTGDELIEMKKTYRRFFRRHFTETFAGIGRGKQPSEAEWSVRSGDLFTRENGYEGPGYGLPAPIIFLTMYGGGLKPFGGPGEYGDEASWHKGLLEYKTMIDKYAPGTMTVYYAWDEPNHAFKGGLAAFNTWMNKVAPWVHSFNRKHKAEIKVYATVSRGTARQVPNLDIYAAHTRAEVEEMEREGDIHCRWNGPQGIAHFASALRVCGWKAYHLRTKIWWMWAWNDYKAGFDVYRNPYNFTNQYGELGAGTGMFVYPGTDEFVTKRNPGLKGPVPGARFFNWRQGFIDFEYLTLAAKVDAKAVDAIVSPLVSGARLNSGLPGEQASVGYAIGDEHYARARGKLVKIILKGR